VNDGPRTMPVGNEFFERQSGTSLTWLGMAGVLVNARGAILLIDPLLSAVEREGRMVSEAGFALDLPLPVTADSIPNVDLICYTHGDEDHIGLKTARILSERTLCRFAAPAPVARILQEAGVLAERITVVQDDDRLQVGAMEIEVTPALHDWQEVNPWQRGDCCGYLLRTPDGSIWHPGDSRLIDELYAYRNVDVLLFDVADVETHLGPYGSARLAESCGARLLIPYHYWTFGASPGEFAALDTRKIEEHTRGLKAKLVYAIPGEVIEVKGL
jgi:L-ascorbate metabolism protein UlaG (beta-lactamase superfamily)